MGAPLRLLAVALCGALAVAGLALGAESQDESFLEPDLAARDQANRSGAAGNLVALTAVLVAAGAALAAGLLSRRRPAERLRAGLVLFLAAYLAAVLAQSMWPNNHGGVEARTASISNSLAAANVPTVPSLFAPVLAVAVGAVLCGGWAARRLLGRLPAPPTPASLLRGQAAAALLAAPFLAVAAWGNLRLLLALPDDEPGLGPYLVALPLAALACLALLALGQAKAWRLGSLVHNGRLAASVQESWQALGRAEAAVAAVLAAIAALATALPATGLGDLLFGGSFAATLRGHTQLLLLLAIPLAPAALHHRRVARYLATAPAHSATLETRTDPLAVAAVAAAAAGLALAGLATWAAGGSLWAWLLALLPAAGVAMARCGPARSAPAALLLAFVLWAIGNTVVARYDGSQEAAILAFRDPPGLLALWRTLGALVAGLAAARLALHAAREGRAAVAVPVALGLGACLAGVALLEMPLAAWLLNRGQGEAIGVGSLVASQDPAVRVLLHSVSAALGLAAAVLLARLHRPDWFQDPPPPPLRAPVRTKRRPARPAPKAAAP